MTKEDIELLEIIRTNFVYIQQALSDDDIPNACYNLGKVSNKLRTLIDKYDIQSGNEAVKLQSNSKRTKTIEQAIGFEKLDKSLVYFLKINNFSENEIKSIYHIMNSFYFMAKEPKIEGDKHESQKDNEKSC